MINTVSPLKGELSNLRSLTLELCQNLDGYELTTSISETMQLPQFAHPLRLQSLIANAVPSVLQGGCKLPPFGVAACPNGLCLTNISSLIIRFDPRLIALANRLSVGQDFLKGRLIFERSGNVLQPMRRLTNGNLCLQLGDRGFANHDLMNWLRQSRWHYCLRLPCDVWIHTQRPHPLMVGRLYPPRGKARLYEHVGLWLDGEHRCNLVLATVAGAEESWAVVTDEAPTLQTGRPALAARHSLSQNRAALAQRSRA